MLARAHPIRRSRGGTIGKAMKTRARRSPLRVLAPLSLIAFGVAFVFVLSNSKIEKHPARAQSTTNPAGTTAPAVNKFAHRRTYTVRTGDTLGSIAEKTSVPVATLEDLNHGLDPQALVAGQKIKLRE
jgi:spore germination protein YaaH